MTEGPIHLEGAGDPGFLDSMHDALATLRRAVECDSATWNAFATAVSEVGADIIEHSGASHLTLSLSSEGDELLAEFEDDGAPYTAPGPPALPADDAERGRGLFIAHSCLDVLDYARTGASNRWRLVKRAAKPTTRGEIE